MNIKSLLVGILIGIVAFPTITLGASFISSLIAGKSVDEAVQILATQLDNLIGRVEIVETKQETIETKQVTQEETISELQDKLIKEEICREADRLLTEIKEACGITPFPGIDECITKRLGYYQETGRTAELNRANQLKELKPLYLSAKSQCEQ